MKIARYSQDAQPTMGDKVIGTNVGDHDNTYNFTFQAIYALFTGSLNQLFVPYTGATADVYLGDYGLSANFLISTQDVSVGRTLYFNGNPGVVGSVPESQGDGASPVWRQPTYGQFYSSVPQSAGYIVYSPLSFDQSPYEARGISLDSDGSAYNRISFLEGGRYLVSVTVSVNKDAGVGTEAFFGVSLKKNDVFIDGQGTGMKITEDQTYVSISFSGLIFVDSDDYISVVGVSTNNVSNLVVGGMRITITRSL